MRLMAAKSSGESMALRFASASFSSETTHLGVCGIVLSDKIGAMPEAGFVAGVGHIKTTGSGTRKSSGLGA